jgi:hypothetical protein
MAAVCPPTKNHVIKVSVLIVTEKMGDSNKNRINLTLDNPAWLIGPFSICAGSP